MHFKFVHVFGFLTICPLIASAKLPVVSMSGEPVSARVAFGDVPTVRGTVSVAPVKRVVSRDAKKNVNINYSAKKMDSDVLSPNLPSSNLWTENSAVTDTPLRMPRMDEVVSLTNNTELPDENLDTKVIADSSDANNSSFDIQATMKRMAEIDARLAKLSELQRRANNSIKKSVQRETFAKADNVNPDVKITRTVVPNDEPDILVRRVETHNVQKQSNTKTMDSLAGLSPSELRKAFRKTFLSENKHLSAMRDISNDSMDTTVTTGMAGFAAETNLSEMGSGIRPFEIKVSFRNSDSALSRDNYTLLTTFAGIVVNDPKRAVQILIPNDATINSDDRKLTARRLAIVEQVLRDTGVPEQRIMPVLSSREDDGGLVLRNIDSTQYETLTKQQRNQFGKTTSKTYKSMTW